jgi:hypothetical protein
MTPQHHERSAGAPAADHELRRPDRRAVTPHPGHPARVTTMEVLR